MVQQDASPIYGEARIIIRVDDQAGGPYLVIRGDNNEPQDGETLHDFFLHSEEEIDQFAAVCKSMLRQAEAADDPEPTATIMGAAT
jgi:hypothetical protein